MDVRTLLETTLSGLGYELVDFELGHGGLMRVFIDAPAGIALDDCVKVSNHLTRLFTVENIDYDRLEVSSPGLDRPLTREADYARFAGERVRIKTRHPLSERKKFAGTLSGWQTDRSNSISMASAWRFRLPASTRPGLTRSFKRANGDSRLRR